MRTAIQVDKERLTSAINKAEETGKLDNLNVLWKKAAEIYNATLVPDEKAISFSVVMLRVKEWNIAVKTQPGRVFTKQANTNSPDENDAQKSGLVTITSNYRAWFDPNCWTLEKRHNDTWKTLGYYASLRQCCTALLDKEAVPADAKCNLQDAVKMMQNMYNSIMETVKNPTVTIVATNKVADSLPVIP